MIEKSGTSLLPVAIALIKKDRRYLIAKRGTKTDFPGLWEFPGGKPLPEETLEECVIREVFEELCVTVKVERFYGQVTHAYPNKTVLLSAYLCCLEGALPPATRERRWASANELLSLPFPEANRSLLMALAAGRSSMNHTEEEIGS